MEVIGTVYNIGDSVTVNASYEKRTLVVKTDEQYPQLILIEFPQGKCNDKIDKLVIGGSVTVGINLRGREWINKEGVSVYFNTIIGWNIK